MDKDTQKIFIFNDSFHKKNAETTGWLLYQRQTQILLYYYLSQSFHKAPKDIPLSCSHYAVYNLSSGYERNVVSRELSVTKIQYKKATENLFHLYMLTNPWKNRDFVYFTEISKQIIWWESSMKMQNLMLIKFGEVKRDLQQKKINSHTVLSDCFDVQDYDFGERLSLFRLFFIRNRFGYCWYIGSVSFCFNTNEISSKVQRLTFLLAQGLLWN